MTVDFSKRGILINHRELDTFETKERWSTGNCYTMTKYGRNYRELIFVNFNLQIHLNKTCQSPWQRSFEGLWEITKKIHIVYDPNILGDNKS